jgi:hypothetical protein
MSIWRALRNAMRVRRTPRIGTAEVERLIAGDPTGPDHDGLATLLAAARAPASPEELADERAAVARFSAAYREQSVRPRRQLRRARVASPARAVRIKVAAATAALAFGGTAVAAETGNLPAPAQDRAHRLFSALGVPAPEATTPRPGTPAATRPTGSTPAPARPTTATAPAPAPAVSGDPAVPGLCRAWHAAQRSPRGAALPEPDRRALTAAAGGPGRIAAFCAPHIVGPSVSPTAEPGRPAEPGKPSRTAKPHPSKPDKSPHKPGQ